MNELLTALALYMAKCDVHRPRPLIDNSPHAILAVMTYDHRTVAEHEVADTEAALEAAKRHRECENATDKMIDALERAQKKGRPE